MISENINTMIMSAMKAGEKEKANVYRLIKNEFLKYNTSKNAKPLDESTEISILQKMVKQREDSINEYHKVGRQDLVDSEKVELTIIQELLPPIPTEDDIQKYLNNNYPNGIEQKQMGIVIKEVKEKLIGADGKLVSDLVKNIIKK